MTSKKLSKDVIDRWPEVFEEITLNVVPLKYLHSIQITFKDKKVWDIDINTKGEEPDWESLEKNIHEMFANYQEQIENIDFKLDTEKVKRDITKETNNFLKKRKL
jgi:hypothetical protein